MSKVESVGEASIKVIPFTGNKRDWPIWSEKFLARGDIKGYREILLGEVAVPTDDEFAEIVDASEKKKAESLRKLNKDAYIDLLLSIATETEPGRVAFQIIRTAKTKEFAGGDAKGAWKRLESKYESKRAPSRLLLKEKFMNSKLKNPRSDPDVWITQLEDLQVQINNSKPDTITEDDLIEHILGNLPSVYDIEIHALRKRLDQADDPLTIEEVREELNLKFEMMNRRFRGNPSQVEEETALFAGGYKGKCYSCGKFGHRAKDCRGNNSNNNNNAKGKSGGNNSHNNARNENVTTGKQGENENNERDKNIECFYCKKKGHRIANCLKLKQKDQANLGIGGPSGESHNNSKSDDDTSDVGLGVIEDIALVEGSSKRKNIFIADSGASCHMTGSLEGLTDIQEINEKITVGNGEVIKATKIGTLNGFVRSDDGTMRRVKLFDCKYVPALAPFNLFSITHALSSGCDLGNDGEKIFIRKGNFKLVFDQRINTKSGYVVGTVIKPCAVESDVANATISSEEAIDVNEFHGLLGHPSESKMRFIAKYYGVKLKGKFEVCPHCAQAKIRQANIPKEVPDEDKSDVPGEKLHMDISSIKARSFGGAKYWLLVLDEATGFIFSYFLKKKSEAASIIVGLIKHLRTLGKITKFIRCDNAGENLATEKLCLQEGLGITFEYSAPNSPQQNGRVERRFATLYGRVRSMLNAAKLNGELRSGLWAECARTATYLDNQDCETSEHKRPRYTEFYGYDDKSFRFIRRFGEMAIVKTGAELRNKLENRGIPALYLGHADKHSAEVGRFLKLTTRRVIRSRDVRWLNKTYWEWMRENGNLTAGNDGFDYTTDDSDDDNEKHDNYDPTEDDEFVTDGNDDDDENVEIRENQVPVPNTMTTEGNKRLQ